MKIKFITSFILALMFTVSSNSFSQSKYVTQTKESMSEMTPAAALEILKNGNKRFLDGDMLHRNMNEQVIHTSSGQYPFAVILGCLDSRVSSELIFDQGIGDVFNARIAGNIVNTDVLGSMEFACKVTGAKLIVVLGHTNCGAIKGACDNVELGNLTQLLSKIKIAEAEVKTSGERNSKNTEFVEDVAKQNVILGMKLIREQSPILNEMLTKGEIGIVGAMYDLETGKVEFYED